MLVHEACALKISYIGVECIIIVITLHMHNVMFNHM